MRRLAIITVCRVVNREFILHEAEKDQFVSMIREYEDFREVEVLTYCVMDNHFHVLVEVSPPSGGPAHGRGDHRQAQTDERGTLCGDGRTAGGPIRRRYVRGWWRIPRLFGLCSLFVSTIFRIRKTCPCP